MNTAYPTVSSFAFSPRRTALPVHFCRCCASYVFFGGKRPPTWRSENFRVLCFQFTDDVFFASSFFLTRPKLVRSSIYPIMSDAAVLTRIFRSIADGLKRVCHKCNETGNENIVLQRDLDVRFRPCSSHLRDSNAFSFSSFVEAARRLPLNLDITAFSGHACLGLSLFFATQGIAWILSDIQLPSGFLYDVIEVVIVKRDGTNPLDSRASCNLHLSFLISSSPLVGRFWTWMSTILTKSYPVVTTHFVLF